jgi:hypothetical protein
MPDKISVLDTLQLGIVVWGMVDIRLFYKALNKLLYMVGI